MPARRTDRTCSCSPSTVASRAPVPPAGRPVNSARPCSSVIAVRSSPPTVIVTCCPAMLLPIASRTTRTVIVPVARSRAGSALPWISDGSGMSELRAARTPRTPSTRTSAPNPRTREPANSLTASPIPQLIAAALAESRVGVVRRATREALLPGRSRRGGPDRTRLLLAGGPRRAGQFGPRFALSISAWISCRYPCPASSWRIKPAARARRRAPISAKSFSETLPIA